MNKKVFVSYTGSDAAYQGLITEVATRLMRNTVQVLYDEWDLKPGHDVYNYMEKIVNDPDIFRVLIFSGREYTKKANKKEGGVGTETQIITPNVYNQVEQEKFIPILLERDENGKPYLPTYLQTSKYIDFSKVEGFEDGYEELLRNILEKPRLSKPELGTHLPDYITNDAFNSAETSGEIRAIESRIKKDGTASFNELSGFTNLFLDKLWEFEMKSFSSNSIEFGQQLLDKLRLYKPLRESFLKFVDIITSKNLPDSTELLIEFFEHQPVYQRPRSNESSWYSGRFDIFKIIFHELFLYTVAIGLRNRDYKLVSDLLHSKYHKRVDNHLKEAPQPFRFLYSYHESLQNYYQQTLKREIGFGEYLITNLSNLVRKEEIITADVLCYFVDQLEENGSYLTWYADTYSYGEGRPVLLFEKMSSKSHFEKIKQLFNINDSEELSIKIKEYTDRNRDRRSSGRGFYFIPPYPDELVKPHLIGIHR